MRLLAVICVSAALARVSAAQAPDRLYVNARVWTGDAAHPAADAIAVRGDQIVAIGRAANLRALAGPATEIVDLADRRVVPGFNDSHWHLPLRRVAELADAGSVAEITRRLVAWEATLPKGAWLLGRGWSPSDFPENRADRAFLDARFPDRPVLLTDRDGHQSLANGAAMRLARVDARTKDPAGGRVIHDPRGAPTGLLQESASSLVRRVVPAPTAAEVAASLEAELTKAASFGLTMLQEASAADPSGAVFDAMHKARDAGSLPVRLRVSIPFAHDWTPARLTEYVALRDRETSPLLRYGIAKGMLDGTVDAKTALMQSPYVGGGTGLRFWDVKALNRAVAAYDRAGLQIELHAIGDRAVAEALDAFAAAATANGTQGRRHRIEHIEVPALADLPRFKSLGVIASTQAIFASPDATTLQNYAPLLGPERASHSNAFKLFDDAGAVQAFGSDYPVFPMDPLRGIYTAVTRTMPDGTPEGGWYPEHRISVEQALRHFTRDAAFAAFRDDEIGVLAVGRAADFVVLSDDILAPPASRILSARVLLTVMGGRVTYRDGAMESVGITRSSPPAR